MFDRVKPCRTCPFLIGGDGLRYLGEDRAVEIADSLLNDQNFSCHSDIDKPEPQRQHCVGAMHILEADNNPNQMMRIGERCGFYDRSKLVGADQCFDNFDDWIEVQSDG